MAKATTCKDAIKALEAEKGVVAAEQEKVRIARDASSVSLSLSPSVSLRACAPRVRNHRSERMKRRPTVLLPPSSFSRPQVLLFAKVPPIEKMDGSLSTLKACAHLSLSTNNIEKISALSGLDNLKILRRVLLYSHWSPHDRVRVVNAVP
jgi:dynein light chain 1